MRMAEFLVIATMLVVIFATFAVVIAYFKSEGGAAGRSIKVAKKPSTGFMSVGDEGNAHNGVDGYHGGSYDGYYGGSFDGGSSSSN